MSIVVGVIGTHQTVSGVLQQGHSVPGVTLLPLPYASEQEAPDLLAAERHRLHAVLYAGPIPYAINRAHGHWGVPATYVPFTGSAFLKGLLAAERAGMDLGRLSIDTLSPAAVTETYTDLGLDCQGVHVLEYVPGMRAKDLVEFHYRHWAGGTACGGLTFLKTAYDELAALGVPVVRQTAAPGAIRAALRMARTMGESAVFRHKNIAVGILHLHGMGELSLRHDWEYGFQEAKLRVHEALLEFSRRISASLVPLGPDQYAFYTTRGAVEEQLQAGLELPDLAHLLDRRFRGVRLGLGFGHTVHQAEKHARSALLRAGEHGDNCSFLVTEDGAVTGPLGPGPSSPAAEAHREELAQACGLSVATLNRIRALAARNGTPILTVADLARELSLSRRSAQRIVTSLTQGGAARPAGRRRPAGRGRPQVTYELLL
ncbi:MAG: hypothetical protein AB1445_11270 [Bacillota bacterium]